MPTRKFTVLPVRAVLLASATTILLAGCGVSNLMNRTRPDEFAVQRQTPLVVPPDFALAPPQPGAPRPSTRTGEQQTLDAMFGGAAPRSDVEKAALERAGTPDTGIRSTVADPKTNTASKGGVTRDIIAAPQGDGREAQTQAQSPS